MNRIRTRAVVVVASSAFLASGFGLTAVAVGSATSATTTLASAQTTPCPNTTVIDYCVSK